MVIWFHGAGKVKYLIGQYVFMAVIAVLLVLPREARVLAEGIPGKGWTQSGEMNIAVMAACRSWESAMKRQGWKKQDAFEMKKDRFVTVWKKQKRIITLLVWEKAIGKSGFAWGEISIAGDKKR